MQVLTQPAQTDARNDLSWTHMIQTARPMTPPSSLPGMLSRRRHHPIAEDHGTMVVAFVMVMVMGGGAGAGWRRW